MMVSSCGQSSEVDTDEDKDIVIMWNTKLEVYLIVDEVEEAPSGELRVAQTGEYLVRNDWSKVTKKESELERMHHYGD